MDFLYFWPSKIRVTPTHVVSSLSPSQCCLSSGWRRHTTAPCHTSFSLSQNELAAAASSFNNTCSWRLPSPAETEALNPHHHHRPPSPDRLTPTLHYYKNVISTLVTIPTIQPHLHFVRSLARVTHHRSSTHHHHSL
jgi:hypothetical protein